MQISVYRDPRAAAIYADSGSLLARCFLPSGGVVDLQRKLGGGYLIRCRGTVITPQNADLLDPFITEYKRLEAAGRKRAVDLDLCSGGVRSRDLVVMAGAALDRLERSGYDPAFGAYPMEDTCRMW